MGMVYILDFFVVLLDSLQRYPDLYRVLVHLHLPYSSELVHGEFGSQELHNGPQLLTILRLMEVT